MENRDRAPVLLGWRRFFRSAILRRRERQPGGSAHDVAFLRGEHSSETVGIDDLLPLAGGHGAQVANRGPHHALAVGRKLLNPTVNLPYLFLLFRSQMGPAVHAIKHAFLLLRRKARKMLQSLPQHLLLRGGQAAEAGIIFQCALPLGRRQILMPPQPIPGMVVLHRRHHPLPMLLREHSKTTTALRKARRTQQAQHYQASRQPSRHETRPRHSPRAYSNPTALRQPFSAADFANSDCNLTDSPPRRAELANHPEDQNQRKARDSFPATANRSRPFPPPMATKYR